MACGLQNDTLVFLRIRAAFPGDGLFQNRISNPPCSSRGIPGINPRLMSAT
jgi:hypothetical protein